MKMWQGVIQFKITLWFGMRCAQEMSKHRGTPSITGNTT